MILLIDGSATAEISGIINESEIVESEEADFGESKEISKNYIDEEEHSDSYDYADSCSDSSDDTDF